MQKIMPIIGITLVGIIVMLFTLPQMIRLEFTIAMAMTITSGQKRYNSCNICGEWDGMFCTCSKLQLRTSPRSRKYRERLITIKRI